MASEDKIDDIAALGFEKKPKIDNIIIDISNLMYRIIGSINAASKNDSNESFVTESDKNDSDTEQELDIKKFNELDDHNKVMTMILDIFTKIVYIKKYYKCNIHVCWEGSNNFRFEVFPAYKANRDRTTELTIDVGKVKTILKEVISHTTITQWDGNYCEGDDIMGTLSRTLKGNNAIYSTDRDFLQLLEDNDEYRVFVLCPRKKLSDLCISYNDHISYFGFHPKDRVFLKSLEGDVGDNIKGCKGIGRKTAVELHKAYGTIQSLYNKVKSVEGKKITETKRSYKERLDSLSLSDSRIRNLKQNEDNVNLALLLGKIKTNADIFSLTSKVIKDSSEFFDKYGWEFYQHKEIFCIDEKFEIRSLEEQKNA